MNKNWHYNNTDYWFDISEEGCMFRLTEALIHMERKPAEENLTPAGKIAAQCEDIRRFFNVLFDEESAGEICGLLKSAESHTRAFVSFVTFVEAQMQAMVDIRMEAEQRFRERALAIHLSRSPIADGAGA
ncbi:MAG: hypothetical protein E7658_01640 [Ruminococcaceae bacterium]|nr:hypothetical protein [Oscillospiraceae bacterium]